MKFPPPYDDLEQPASLEAGVYEHYKGNRYYTNGHPCYDSERHTWVVLYSPEDVDPGCGPTFVRDIDSFLEEVDSDGLGTMKQRFTRQNG